MVPGLHRGDQPLRSMGHFEMVEISPVAPNAPYFILENKRSDGSDKAKKTSIVDFLTSSLFSLVFQIGLLMAYPGERLQLTRKFAEITFHETG